MADSHLPALSSAYLRSMDEDHGRLHACRCPDPELSKYHYSSQIMT